jgi:hypothetical protein
MVMVITIMVVTIIIERYEAGLARRASGNLLVYGRRKVGKTYLVRNFIKYDIYVLVNRGGGIYIEGGPFENLDSYDQFLGLLTSWIADGKTVIVDEFQRLPKAFIDRLQTIKYNGRIILTGSSFHVSKDVLSQKSPILGMFSDLRLTLISPEDIFKGLAGKMSAENALQLAPYLRDPWTIPYFRGGDTTVEDILLLSRQGIRALLGEVFQDEEKDLSAVYEGIVRLLSMGKWKLGQMADTLFSRKIISKPDPHRIRPYFNNMETMDLVRRIPIHGRKEFMYTVSSPVMELGFLLDEKYGFFNHDIPEKALKAEISNAVPGHIERFCGEMLARMHGGRFEYFYSSDFDIDFIITRGKKVVCCGEVKWGKKSSRSDVDLLVERTRHLPGEKVFISRNMVEDARVTALDPNGLLKLVAGKV